MVEQNVPEPTVTRDRGTAARKAEQKAIKRKPSVRIRVSDTGQMTRRKRKATAEEMAARSAEKSSRAKPERAKVVAIMTRAKVARQDVRTPQTLKRAVETEARLYDSRASSSSAGEAPDRYTRVAARLERAEARRLDEEIRKAAYQKEIAARRISITGSKGKTAEREQAKLYRAAGIDERAGFNGQPPAFIAAEKHKIGKGELLGPIRNVSRDPVHILRTQGVLTERAHTALAQMVDLLEQHASLGVRAMGFTEAVDGGKAPDVSTHALAVARRMAAFEKGVSEADRHLLTAVATGGQTISDLARAGTFGTSRNTVQKKLTAALERLADYFGVK